MNETMNERAAGRLERVPSRALRLLAPRPGAGLEGLQESSPGAAQESLPRQGLPDGIDSQRIAQRLRAVQVRAAPDALQGRDPAAEAQAQADTLVATARNAMDTLLEGGSRESLSFPQVMALEAVLHTRGRPALRVEGDSLEALSEEKHPGSGFWRVIQDQHENAIIAATGSTGAVVVNDTLFANGRPWVQGTAWLIAPDLVITNRHVLFPPFGQALARRRPGAPTAARIKSDLEVSLDFAFDNGPARTQRYRVLEVPFVSAPEDPIDVALLRIERLPSALAVPSPLRVAAATLEARELERLYVIGHPGRMPNVPEDVRLVFNDPDERKRVSYGETMDPDDANPHDLVYDPSTIGGFSGGSVLAFGAGEVVALHYWGNATSGNRALTCAALRAHAVGAHLP
jgi:Trypsin-like peptidase domain